MRAIAEFIHADNPGRAFSFTRELRQRCYEIGDFPEAARRVPGFEYVEVPAAEVPLTDAVRSYLFNAQLVTPPDGEPTLVVPAEARRDVAQRCATRFAAAAKQ